MRILTIGDSITLGMITTTDRESGGYRFYLDQKLAAAGIDADFVEIGRAHV
jgi:hypothetical protein